MKFKLNLFSKHHLQSVLSSKGGTGYEMNPVRDWTIALSIATLSFLVGTTFIAFDFYTQISQAPKQEVTVTEKPMTYNEKDVVRYAELYAERADMFNRLREEKVYVPPPVEIESDEQEVEDAKPLATEEEEQYTDPAPEQVQ
jgi:hypothetical protein